MAQPTVTRRRFTTATVAAATLGAARPAAAAERVLTVGASVFPDSLVPGSSSFASESLLHQTNDAPTAPGWYWP